MAIKLRFQYGNGAPGYFNKGYKSYTSADCMAHSIYLKLDGKSEVRVAVVNTNTGYVYSEYTCYKYQKFS
jgi:hypothetical protein